IKVAEMAASELKKKYGTVYKVGSFANLLSQHKRFGFTFKPSSVNRLLA
ncbi:unnamed protein product, partial [Ranitomeya imitator]